MVRPRVDDRDQSKVAAAVRPHFVAIAPGTTRLCATTYAGPVEVVAPAEHLVNGAMKPVRCDLMKCLHCPAKFSGDLRRQARHFLPRVLPKDFWPKGHYCGVARCTAPPEGIVDQLREAGAQEFVKLDALQRGVGEAVPTVATKGAKTSTGLVASSARVAWASGARDVKDPERYKEDPVESRGVSRLFLAAMTTGAVPLAFVKNKCFNAALDALQLALAGEIVYKLPNEQVFAEMRAMEAAAAAQCTSAWMRSSIYGTVALDGRMMKEGANKEHMLNGAFVAQGEERWLRCEDMAGVAKDAKNMYEFVEAAFWQPQPPEINVHVFEHVPPSVHINNVAAVVLDQPAANVAVLKSLAEKRPGIAPVPCAFHAFDNLLGHLRDKITPVARTCALSKKMTKFVSNQSRVRVALTKCIKRRVSNTSVESGRKVRARFFVKARKTRAYPVYHTVKRCLQLSYTTALWFKSQEARDLCGAHKHFPLMKAWGYTQRGKALKGMRLTVALFRPILKKLRLVDSTCASVCPQLLLHFADLRGQLTDAWVAANADLEALPPHHHVQYGELLQVIVKECNATFKKLTNKWSFAAFLCDPHNVLRMKADLEQHGPFHLDPEFDHESQMPAGLTDRTCYRTFGYYGERAFGKVIDIIYKGDDDNAQRARYQLDAYLRMNERFSMQHATAFWKDGDWDAMSPGCVLTDRPVSLENLWARSVINAPQLQRIMRQLAAIYPAQSAVERMNALVKYTGGNTLRNNLKLTTRIQMCQIADHYNHRQAGNPALPKRTRKGAIKHIDDDDDEVFSDDDNLGDEVLEEFGLSADAMDAPEEPVDLGSDDEIMASSCSASDSEDDFDED